MMHGHTYMEIRIHLIAVFISTLTFVTLYYTYIACNK